MSLAPWNDMSYPTRGSFRKVLRIKAVVEKLPVVESKTVAFFDAIRYNSQHRWRSCKELGLVRIWEIRNINRPNYEDPAFSISITQWCCRGSAQASALLPPPLRCNMATLSNPQSHTRGMSQFQAPMISNVAAAELIRKMPFKFQDVRSLIAILMAI